jgi:hypothetical protein
MQSRIVHRNNLNGNRRVCLGRRHVSQDSSSTPAGSSNSSDQSCTFVRHDGSRCSGEIEAGGSVCFWHDADADKEGDDIRARLEQWAGTDESMEGFVLRYASLQGVKLASQRGRVLRGANLFRANLAGAHLFNVDLQGADMLKANLAGANMNEAKLQGVDLLGATLDGTRLERVQWGDASVNEQAARESLSAGRKKDALEKFEEAEEVYRTLRQAYDGAGRFEQAGVFFRREMTMRRMLLPMWSLDRLWSKLVDTFCAYGESPPRVIVSATLINLIVAVIFWLVGINGPDVGLNREDGRIGIDLGASVMNNVLSYFHCVYYSVVTFTTLGYGEMTPPTLLTRNLAAGHAFMGAFMMAMFVAVFGKKMTRG